MGARTKFFIGFLAICARSIATCPGSIAMDPGPEPIPEDDKEGQEDLRKWVQALQDELENTNNVLAEVVGQLEDAKDKIWELTPKEKLPKGESALQVCKSNGKKSEKYPGWKITDQVCMNCETSPQTCEEGGWLHGLCECEDKSKIAVEACKGKKDRDPCKMDLTNRTSKETAKGTHETTTGRIIESVCVKEKRKDDLKCRPYLSLPCFGPYRVEHIEWKGEGARCTNIKNSDSMRAGLCRKDGKSIPNTLCVSTIKIKIYSLSKCEKDGETMACKPGYHPEVIDPGSRLYGSYLPNMMKSASGMTTLAACVFAFVLITTGVACAAVRIRRSSIRAMAASEDQEVEESLE